MSASQLENLLKEAINVLKKDPRLVEGLKQHTAVFQGKSIADALIEELKFIRVKNNSQKYPAWHILDDNAKNQLNQYINLEAEKIIEKLHRAYKDQSVGSTSRSNNWADIRVSNIVNNSFTVTTTTRRNDVGVMEKQTGIGKKYTIQLNSFNTIREIYNAVLRELWIKISDKVSESIDKDKVGRRKKENVINDMKKKAFIALEHKAGESISEIRRDSAFGTFFKSLISATDSYSAEQIFKELGLSVQLKYVSKNEATNINVIIGSFSSNARKGATIERQFIKDAEGALQDALKEIPNTTWVTSGGSDDRLTIEKKKIVANFKNSLKNNKNIKSIKTIDTKLKLSNRKSKNKKIPIKVTNIKTSVSFKGKPSNKQLNIKSKETKESTLNLNALKAQINARLSMTVIKNMGTPALENRTGRFARSVQVTDVTQTSKGFPSIGYTYQKYPYQTFEPGFKQGSTQRDPRTLIDRSIRDIAKDLIVGRFYTRRV